MYVTISFHSVPKPTVTCEFQPEGDLEFASRSFARLKAAAAGSEAPVEDTRDSSTELLAVFSVMGRYCRARPTDATALHLFGLVCESLGLEDRAIELMDQAITILEAAYEESEDPQTERQYAIAHANRARLCLATERYEEAVESFETSLGLLPEDDEDGSSMPLRIQANWGKAISYFRQGDLPAALSAMEESLQAAGDSNLRSQVAVLLSQLILTGNNDACVDSASALLLER